MNLSFAAAPTLADSYRRRFTDTMGFVAGVFPFGFRRARAGSATPRTRFEAIAIGSFFALQSNPDLRQSPPNVARWLHKKEKGQFLDMIGSDGANAKARLQGRMNFVRDRLLEG